MTGSLSRFLALCSFVVSTLHLNAEPARVLNLWPGPAPGDPKVAPTPEHDTTKPTDGLVGGNRVIRLGDVYQPTIAVYAPDNARHNGAAVIVCPGGAYSILAMDLEGTEVCAWLNSIGVTGILLKYRVPKRPGLEKYTAALQDAQRALGMARSHAVDWKLNPSRIGIMGFSAGGHLAALLSNNYSQRSYPQVDAADEMSCRPDFTILIYPAYLVEKDHADQLSPEFHVTSQTPPAFIAMAEDDPVHVENALGYAEALHQAKVSCELHVYPTGGHGYGLRPSKNLVTTWPARAADWMRSQGLLEK